MTLHLLPQKYAICRFARGHDFPQWAFTSKFFSITRTADELSLVCEEDFVPAGTHCEGPWRILKVQGPLDFSLTGILNSISQPLAAAQISIFAISTFDTDYILVREDQANAAIVVLGLAEFEIVQST